MNARASFLASPLVAIIGVIAACSSDPADPPRKDCDQSPSACSPGAAPSDSRTELDDAGPTGGDAAVPVTSDAPFFGTAYVEDNATLGVASDGDLWPSCWSNDDALYTANGDGKAFGEPFVDIAMSRVTGSPFASPPNLKGSTLARSEQLGSIWTKGSYNRKPTGMLCIDGAIYLAVQDLQLDFLDAPAATIAVSKDHGATWSWNKEKPMFSDFVMTTLMFLDFGKDSANAIDGFVYVYALDNNWRFTSRRLSPTKLWLARTPKDKVLDRKAWTYFAGTDADGTPRFEADIAKRKPVLEDTTKVYTKPFYSNGVRDMTVVSQGGIVYDAPLKRYLYTSWTEFTFEFYEAPQPWGPWKKFLTRDYGPYPWSASLNGGYATTIPSKFISPDGKTMFVQSNTFVGGVKNYELSFRKLLVEPFVATPQTNTKSENNLAYRENGGVPFSRAGHAGPTASLNDGFSTGSVDSWTDEEKTEDFWGVVWPHPWTVNTVSYTTGKMFSNGGWFTSLRVQARRNGEWVDVPDAQATPTYPMTSAAGDNRTYEFSFEPIAADGVRVIGTPGGSTTFTSASEISAQYR